MTKYICDDIIEKDDDCDIGDKSENEDNCDDGQILSVCCKILFGLLKLLL